ncbi:MAG: pyruvate, phosphate dikinase [Acidimicrobiia bacterium]|nr:pyruvate, phosphate dikinase [Acidimicrobiia bacterium]
MTRTGQQHTNWVAHFKDADETQRDLLGGKGAGLAAMTQIGLPVPPGFTITTEACRAFYDAGGVVPEGLWSQVETAVADLEAVTGKRFADPSNPLLLSVRSGSPVSMPGMMDTLLDLGMNDDTVVGLAALTGDEPFAWDAYRRFLQMYADVVLGIDSGIVHGVADDPQFAVSELKSIIEAKTGDIVLSDPMTQLQRSIVAIFKSWMNRRAVDYRSANGIPDDLFTAANVQVMVFGNIGEDSGTGVVFTRDPTSGEPKLWGEYLPQAQGEDIVSGMRTPLPVSALAEHQPDAYRVLEESARTVEEYYKDMQDIEFTVESGKLWMLQTRRGKRAGRSAVRCAVDMANEGLISRADAVSRVAPSELDELLHPVVKAAETDLVFASGLAASPGGASGIIALTADDAERLAAEGHDVVLIRDETSPDDFHGMVASRAIVTARGGMTSHAAVVARGMGMCCVVGCKDLTIDEEAGTIKTPNGTASVGDFVTVDGSAGLVYLGVIPTVDAVQDDYFSTLLDWASELSTMGVRTNADTPAEAAQAREFGAEGIGLCRTEHMFFDANRIEAVRAMIMAPDSEARAEALAVVEPFQTDDFLAIFAEMDGLPVTIRLLDPPLHEFLPNRSDTFEEILRLELEGPKQGEDGNGNPEERLTYLRDLLVRTDHLAEANPMLGHRGVRLGVSHPEITAMQTRAILTAAVKAKGRGIDVRPEIMVPLVAYVTEYRNQKQVIVETAEAVFADLGERVDFTIGSMIELPRACFIAGEIAAEADFLSFGTNDLTQTTLGLSRDDSSRFLPGYVIHGLIDADPFVQIDVEGVGALVALATKAAREANPEIHIGVCGEHGGNPASVDFFSQVGLDYVSCSPFRVPLARLAVAQVASPEQPH